MDSASDVPRNTIATLPPLFRSERIPFEIWLQIIEFSSLDHRDIIHLTLVSKFLRYVAQPMLFATFRVTIIRARYLKMERCQSAGYLNRLNQRLEFALLPRIVQSVKAIDIRMGGETRSLDAQEAVKEETVVWTLFQHIHHLTNLRSFSAQNVSLTGAHFDCLAELKYFQGIHLTRCSCTGDLGLARFKLRHLSLHGKMTGSHGWWIPLLKCSSLQHLSYDAVPGPPGDPELLFPALATGPVLHSLRTLRLPDHAAFYPCFSLALSRCSSVENLYVDHIQKGWPVHFTPSDPNYPMLSQDALPKLRAVSAPYDFVRNCILVAPGCRPLLKHIRTADILFTALPLHDLITNRCPTLEELVIRVTDIRDNVWIQSLLTSLISIRGLHITYDRTTASDKDLRSFLKQATYPASLRSLHIVPSRPLPAASASAGLSSKQSRLIKHIKKNAPDLIEIKAVIQKSISWRDMYTRSVKWYEWDARGGRSELL